jgi:hypothetical protein
MSTYTAGGDMRAARCIWIAAFLVVLATEVDAQPAPEPNSAVAEALFREGRRLFDEGNIDAACIKFAASQGAEPSTGTLLNLAICHDKQGRTATAWAEFLDVATTAARGGQSKREAYALSRAAELEATLSRLRIELAEPLDGMVIHLDATVLSSDAVGTAVPLDPGSHKVEVSAPGKQTWSTTVTIEEGPSEQALVVPTLVDVVPEPPPPPAPAVAVPSPETPKPPPPEIAPSISPWVWVGVAVGGAGLTMGAVTGALSLSKAGDIDDACVEDSCPPGLEGEYDEAVVLANVSNVGFAVAGLGLGIAIVGAFLSGTEGTVTATRVTPSIGFGSVGLGGSF